MPDTEMIVMVAVIAGAALTLIHLFRLAGTTVRHHTLRKLVDADPAKASALLANLDQPETRRAGDDRLALILVAIGVAMALGSVIAIQDPGPLRVGIAASLFPLLVGAALGIRLYLAERRRRAGSE